MKDMIKNKKGVLDQIGGVFIGIAVIAVIAVLVFLLLANLAANTQVAADGNATAALDSITEDAAELPGWIGLAITVIIMVLLLGLIMVLKRRT